MKTRHLFIALLLNVQCFGVNADFLKMPSIGKPQEIKETTLLRDMSIPAVRKRALDPNSGPRLAVAEFRIQGLLEYPELGITHKAVAQLMEQVRFELMGEGELLKSGYTIKELGELSNLLVDIEEETLDREVSDIEVQQLVWLVRSQRGKRGVTLGQIEAVAHTITQFYRERGFILAKAYIPKQEVRDGVVNLTVLLGMLGEIAVHKNENYGDDIITSVFDSMIGKPVTNEKIEEGLYILNNYPGLSLNGYFESGSQVGDTLLNINVKDEKKYNLNSRIDNHGTDNSGLYRFYIDGQINNVFDQADKLKFSVLQAVSPQNTTFGRFDYESNFFSPYFRVSIDFSQNQFIVDQSSASFNRNLNGTVNVYGGGIKYIAQRSRTNNSTYKLRYEKLNSDLKVGDLNPTSEKVTQLSLGYDFDALNDKAKRLHAGTVTYTNGTIDSDTDVGQEDAFNILNIDYTLLNFIKVPFTNSNSRFIVRNNLQYSGQNMPSITRFSLAGPTKSRGFSSSLFTADDGLFIGADWIFNSPSIFDFSIGSFDFSNTISPMIFVDYSYGIQYSLDDRIEDTTASIADVGVGLEFSSGGFSGNLTIGFPVLETYSTTDIAESEDSMRLSFNFQYAIF